MGYEFIKTEKKEQVFVIRLNNPKARTALALTMRYELLDAFNRAETDDEIKAIILTGEGKAFSAGGDLNALKSMGILEGRKRLQLSQPLIMKILEIEKPVIAAVNGAAAGAGFSLALLCDFIIAAEEAFFVQSFVNVGLIPDFAAIHFLPLIIGPHKAKELMFLGERVPAKDAEKIGLVSRVVPGEKLMDAAMELASNLAEKSPVSIGMTKKIMNHHFNRDLKVLLEMEAQGQALCFQTEDFQEGVNAFFEKRKQRFTGK